MDDPKAQEEGLKSAISEYSKLNKINKSEEFNTFFDLQLKTVSEKMLWAFTTGKEGDNVKNWDDFCKIRGEIVARLHPIQEVRSAQAMKDHLKQQLDTYYGEHQ